ncbi:MAG: sodium:calcium antiporter [Candidatus Binatia bacterium]
MLITWLQFFLCAGVITFAGTRLTRYGDIIAEKTGLGRTWIGVVLLATVTSLPELFTGVSSVLLFNVPDIAAGNVIGACMLNMLTIAFLDLVGGATPVSTRAHQGHVLSAGFSILMLGIVGLILVSGETFGAIAWIGTYSFVLLGIYSIAMKMLFSYEKRRVAEFVKEFEEAQYQEISNAQAYGWFATYAFLIVAAAIFLPFIGDKIADETRLGESFVGSVFIAIATTLPELTVSYAAYRIGAVDMAVGNLFGSNLFNVNILALDDLLYTQGPILNYVSGNHVVSVIGTMAMSAVAIIGLTFRSARKRFLLSWDAMTIVALYGLTAFLLFRGR